MKSIEIDDIVGISEIAVRVELSQPAVSNWTQRHDDFPKPIKVLKCGPLFSWKEVEAWWRQGRVVSVTRTLEPK